MIRTLLASAVLLPSIALGGEPSQFRGPEGRGVFASIEHPLEWSGDKNMAWKTELPGQGWSAPAVSGDHIFVTSAKAAEQKAPKNMKQGVQDPGSMPFFGQKPPSETYDFQLHCLDRSNGKVLWSKSVAKLVPAIPKHASNTYATESPAADAERVYTWYGSVGVLACFDHDGKQIWRKDIPVYKMGSGFGTGSSLRLFDGRLFLQRDNEEESAMHAFNPKTGEELWKVDRECGTSWATPIVWKAGNRYELIGCGAGMVMAYDPASGKELWRLEQIPSSFSASPTADGDHVFFGSGGPGSGSPLYAVKAGANGDVTLLGEDRSDHVWTTRNSGVGMASLLAYDGIVYVSSQGRLKAFDGASGEEVYRARVPEATTFVGSPWAGDGKIFLIDEDGSTFVIKAGREFELLGTNKLDDTVWSTPTAYGKDLLIRGVNALYCIRGS